MVHDLCQRFQDNTVVTEENKSLEDSSLRRVSSSKKRELFFLVYMYCLLSQVFMLFPIQEFSIQYH